jgi:uncharacterized tellurite resistance protein B-like protein
MKRYHVEQEQIAAIAMNGQENQFNAIDLDVQGGKLKVTLINEDGYENVFFNWSSELYLKER